MSSDLFSSDGATLAAGEYGEVTLWSVAQRQRAATLQGFTNDRVISVAFSADDATLASIGSTGLVSSGSPDREIVGYCNAASYDPTRAPAHSVSSAVPRLLTTRK